MKTCRQCQSAFEVSEQDKNFYKKITPIINGQIFPIPEPTLCPSCREIARLAFRNERYYYQRSCDLCKKSIISVYNPGHTKNVYCHECFWSDKWDPKNYAKPFDP